MPRTLSALARKALYSQETGEVPILLLTILVGSEIAARICDSFTPVTSRGQTFSPFPFSLVLPEESDEGAMRARLAVDNVSRELTAWLRSLQPSPVPTVRIELVLAGTPDVVERSWPRLMFGAPVVDAATISVELTDYDISQEPVSQLTFDPAGFPGLFK